MVPIWPWPASPVTFHSHVVTFRCAGKKHESKLPKLWKQTVRDIEKSRVSPRLLARARKGWSGRGVRGSFSGLETGGAGWGGGGWIYEPGVQGTGPAER